VLITPAVLRPVQRYLRSAQYWEDPHAFKPARFLGDWPRDAYLPFNAGANFPFLLRPRVLFERMHRQVLDHVWAESEDLPRDSFVPLVSQLNESQRFFEASSLVILSILISRYKIEIKEEPQFAGETFRQREERILAFRAAVTVT
jgi:hypothetical protein